MKRSMLQAQAIASSYPGKLSASNIATLGKFGALIDPRFDRPRFDRPRLTGGRSRPRLGALSSTGRSVEA
jgi:hypothetical protein